MPNLTVDDYTFGGLGLEGGRLRRILDTVPQMVWSTSTDGMADFYNRRWYDFTGTQPGDTHGDRWLQLVHPEDRETAAAAWASATGSGGIYDTEYRLRRYDGEYRWMLARGQPLIDGTGAVARWFGTCTDIEEMKRTEAANAMIAGELSHRIGNLFSVVIGLVSLSVPRASPFRAEADKLVARLSALARAHDRFRLGGPTASLHDLLDGVMKPYAQDGGGRPRVTIEGADLPVGERHTTALALVMHELATNAVKHGALSTECGRVTISVCDEPGGFCLIWREDGGPPVTPPKGPPARNTGFGSSLVRRLAALQLGSEPQFHWRPEGLEVTVRVAVAK